MSQDTKPTGVKRREFLKVLGASSAALTATACSEETGKLIPYLVSPDETVPGVSTYYATTCRECGAGCGVIAETRDGRVIKLEGNPDHPLNHGALCARGQASLQGLYNPDRFRAPMVKEGGAWKTITWDDALNRLAAGVAAAKGKGSVFLNQHESGSFPRFVDSWLAGVRILATPERRLRSGCRGDRSESSHLRCGVAVAELQGREADRLVRRRFPRRLGRERSAAARLRRRARQARWRSALHLHRTASLAHRFERRRVARVQAGQRARDRQRARRQGKRSAGGDGQRRRCGASSSDWPPSSPRRSRRSSFPA